jgi:hypothetical protein
MSINPVTTDLTYYYGHSNGYKKFQEQGTGSSDWVDNQLNVIQESFKKESVLSQIVYDGQGAALFSTLRNCTFIEAISSDIDFSAKSEEIQRITIVFSNACPDLELEVPTSRALSLIASLENCSFERREMVRLSDQHGKTVLFNVDQIVAITVDGFKEVGESVHRVSCYYNKVFGRPSFGLLSMELSNEEGIPPLDHELYTRAQECFERNKPLVIRNGEEVSFYHLRNCTAIIGTVPGKPSLEGGKKVTIISEDGCSDFSIRVGEDEVRDFIGSLDRIRNEENKMLSISDGEGRRILFNSAKLISVNVQEPS